MRELLVVRMGGGSYGVWMDDVAAVKMTGAARRLPLAPAHVAGVGEVEGRTATLFDLSSYLGHGPCAPQGPGRVLVMSEEEPIEGFLFKEEGGRIGYSPENLLPMPECVRTAEFEGCAVFDGDVVPVLAVGALYERVRAGAGPMVAGPAVSSEPGSQAGGTFRVFELGGEKWAVPGEAVRREAEAPGLVRRLPLAPAHIRGLACQGGGAVAVADLAPGLGLPFGGRLVLELAGGLGILVDRDMGEREGAVCPLPPLARTRWMRRALCAGGEVVPVLDVSALGLPENLESAPGHHAPDEGTERVFGVESFEVVEFSVLGKRYSVPGAEVADVVPLEPFRRLRRPDSLLVGLATRGEEVLPVADPGLCFGVPSEPGEAWEMLLVEKGQFRALVPTEEMLGRRLVPMEARHRMPIPQPHPYVYGCYTGEGSVTVVLNLEILATRFDSSLVNAMFAGVFGAAKHAMGEEVDAGTAGEGESGAVAAETGLRAAQEPPVAKPEGRTEEAGEAILGAAGGGEPGAVAAEAGLRAEESPPVAKPGGETEEPDAAGAGPREAEEAGSEAEKPDTREKDGPGWDDEPVFPSSGRGGGSHRVGRAVGVGVFISGILVLAALGVGLYGGGSTERAGGPVPSVGDAPVEVALEKTEPADRGSPGDEDLSATPAGGMAEPPVVEPPVVEPGVTEPPVAVEAAPGQEPVVVLEVVPMPVAEDTGGEPRIDVEETYLVRRGDTLWDIAERFTGNPFRYGLIAGDNEIENPDLIYPGQKILVRVTAPPTR